MRFFNVQSVARPSPIDRNQLQKLFAVTTVAAAPHGTTSRYSYTVPASRKALIEFISQVIERVTAAAPVGITQSFHQYTPSGGAATNFALTALGTNGVNDNATQNFSVQKSMGAGDNVQGFDNDVSTGGTVTFIESLSAVEFDA